ncbi:MAG: NAD-dependent epimerase/dehydratase family protein, partial [Planctomycetes bacterium]|nr:NAD-dependent epimerase/dehydratase family protein [Planctomycetota bacterium]
MHVAITGVSGFIGSTIARHLSEAGHTVTGLVRATSRTDHIEAVTERLVVADQGDEEAELGDLDGDGLDVDAIEATGLRDLVAAFGVHQVDEIEPRKREDGRQVLDRRIVRELGLGHGHASPTEADLRPGAEFAEPFLPERRPRRVRLQVARRYGEGVNHRTEKPAQAPRRALKVVFRLTPFRRLIGPRVRCHPFEGAGKQIDKSPFALQGDGRGIIAAAKASLVLPGQKIFFAHQMVFYPFVGIFAHLSIACIIIFGCFISTPPIGASIFGAFTDGLLPLRMGQQFIVEGSQNATIALQALLQFFHHLLAFFGFHDFKAADIEQGDDLQFTCLWASIGV